MMIMYSFCFWYSVRLGTIIVAASCMVQCLAALISCGYGISDLERSSSDIEFLLEKSQFYLARDFFQVMKDETIYCLVAFIMALLIYFLSCISLIYAAFQCKVNFMYPFLVLDFVRLVILSLAVVVILILVKENTLNLGIIIGCSLLGGFTMLFLWYQWLCTVSLWQIIMEMGKLERGLVTNEPPRRPGRSRSDNLNPFYSNSLYLPKISH